MAYVLCGAVRVGAMGGVRVSMVAALARLREAAARIARLLGIRAMRNALRAQEGGQHYDCAAQICRKRARPLQCAEHRVSQPKQWITALAALSPRHAARQAMRLRKVHIMTPPAYL